MSLGQKTITILSLTIVGLMVLLYSAAHMLVMRSFSSLENQQAQVAVDRVRNELAHDSLAGLAATTNDYGAWDRMYSYLAPLSVKPIAEEFQNGTLQGLRINSVLVTDLAGHVVYSKAYDFHQHSSSSQRPETEEAVALDPWVRRVIASSTHASGVLLQPTGAVLIAACPITTTEHQGPVRGVVVMTRNLDSQALMDLQTITRTHLSIATVSDPQMPADFQWARKQFASDAESLPVQALDTNTISGYALLRDIHGEPALILRADDDRRVSQSGLTSLRYFLAVLCIVSLSFALTTWHLLHDVVLSRLSQLHAQVSDITACGWTAKHVQIGGEDEISTLGDAINAMLDTLRSTETKLDLLANNIHQIFWVQDAASLKFTYISSGYPRIWGQSCETLFADAESWMQPVHPDDRNIVDDVLNMQRRGEIGEVKFRIVGPDGRTTCIWGRFFPVRDATGKVQQSVGILEDITEYKGTGPILLLPQDQLGDALAGRREKLQAGTKPGYK